VSHDFGAGKNHQSNPRFTQCQTETLDSLPDSIWGHATPAFALMGQRCYHPNTFVICHAAHGQGVFIGARAIVHPCEKMAVHIDKGNHYTEKKLAV
jgi:hypothetical protein